MIHTVKGYGIVSKAGFQGKTFNITVIEIYAPSSSAEEAEVELFYEDLQDLLELTPKKDVLFIMLLLLLLSRFSRVQLCVTPQRAAHQAPPSLGFSRQEHWSGLPFSSQSSISLFLLHSVLQDLICLLLQVFLNFLLLHFSSL